MAGQSQHYVPKMYLRGFFDPAQVANRQNVLWRYRPGSRPQAKGVTKVAEQTDFYDLPNEQENDIEELFSEIERNVAPSLKKLRGGGIPLKAREKAELATYFALQYTRTPWFRELVNNSVIQLHRASVRSILDREDEFAAFLAAIKADGDEVTNVQSLRDYLERLAAGDVLLQQRNLAWNVRVMLDQADRLGEVFARARWNLLEAQAGSAFITSDQPLHVVDPVAVPRLSLNRFQFSDEMEFYFPLSPKFMVVGDLRAEPDRHLVVTTESVRMMNRGQMARAQELYASFYSQELQAEFDEAVKTRPPSIRELPQDFLVAKLRHVRARHAAAV